VKGLLELKKRIRQQQQTTSCQLVAPLCSPGPAWWPRPQCLPRPTPPRPGPSIMVVCGESRPHQAVRGTAAPPSLWNTTRARSSQIHLHSNESRKKKEIIAEQIVCEELCRRLAAAGRHFSPLSYIFLLLLNYTLGPSPPYDTAVARTWVHDPRSPGTTEHVLEGLCAPLEECKALLVALKLQLHVRVQGRGGPRHVHLHRSGQSPDPPAPGHPAGQVHQNKRNSEHHKPVRA